MKYRSIATVSIAHLVTDINQGAIPALLPFLIATHGLSYTAAATVVFAANISSSLVQPLFGHFADRISKPFLMPLGAFLAGLGLALAGVVPTYGLVLAMVAVSGIGVASFHPEAARFVHALSGTRKAMGLSLFAVGGQLGLAIGPIMTALAVASFGLRGTLLLLVPFVCMVPLVLGGRFFVKPLPAALRGTSGPGAGATDQWLAFVRLSGAVFCRSFTYYGLSTFLPLYWMRVFDQTAVAGGGSLTIFLGAGVCGTLFGGRMADRYGYRNVALIALCCSTLVLPIFTMARSVTGAMLLLIPLGLAHFTSYSPMVVLGQKLLPNHVGLASGVTLGLVVSVGGIAAPIFGRLADTFSIETTFSVIALLPALASCLMLTFPRRDPAT
ncbi:MAG: MFS transporter [Desulfobacteraceae bacterium]|nr:MAG: MFS transporter [Desulfobacteraceae bacterium]